jgi:hypothetical protein
MAPGGIAAATDSEEREVSLFGSPMKIKRPAGSTAGGTLERRPMLSRLF